MNSNFELITIVKQAADASVLFDIGRIASVRWYHEITTSTEPRAIQTRGFLFTDTKQTITKKEHWYETIRNLFSW